MDAPGPLGPRVKGVRDGVKALVGVGVLGASGKEVLGGLEDKTHHAGNFGNGLADENGVHSGLPRRRGVGIDNAWATKGEKKKKEKGKMSVFFSLRIRK